MTPSPISCHWWLRQRGAGWHEHPVHWPVLPPSGHQLLLFRDKTQGGLKCLVQKPLSSDSWWGRSLTARLWVSTTKTTKLLIIFQVCSFLWNHGCIVYLCLWLCAEHTPLYQKNPKPVLAGSLTNEFWSYQLAHRVLCPHLLSSEQQQSSITSHGCTLHAVLWVTFFSSHFFWMCWEQQHRTLKRDAKNEEWNNMRKEHCCSKVSTKEWRKSWGNASILPWQPTDLHSLQPQLACSFWAQQDKRSVQSWAPQLYVFPIQKNPNNPSQPCADVTYLKTVTWILVLGYLCGCCNCGQGAGFGENSSVLLWKSQGCANTCKD